MHVDHKAKSLSDTRSMKMTLLALLNILKGTSIYLRGKADN